MADNILPLRHIGDPNREIDFDLYVDLLVIWKGFTRRDAEIEVRRECRRDNLTIVRSDSSGGRYSRIGIENELVKVAVSRSTPDGR